MSGENVRLPKGLTSAPFSLRAFVVVIGIDFMPCLAVEVPVVFTKVVYGTVVICDVQHNYHVFTASKFRKC